MAKKAKALEVKLRSAIRLIWSRSAERRAILKNAEQQIFGGNYARGFSCPDCKSQFPMWAAEVDHEPPIGPLGSWRDTVGFIERMFFGPQRVICKQCHKDKTAKQRRKK